MTQRSSPPGTIRKCWGTPFAAFHLVGPPFTSGMTSVFDGPEPKRRTALHRASKAGDVESLPSSPGRTRRKVDAVDASGATPLMLAAGNGHVDLVSCLLEMGADPRTIDDWKWTALHYGADAGSREVVRLLLDAGADIDDANWTEKHLCTSLQLEVTENHSSSCWPLERVRTTPDVAAGRGSSPRKHLATVLLSALLGGKVH